MAQKTAVMELLNFILVERRSKEDGSIKFHAHEDFERFLEMEKENIKKAFSDGQELSINNPLLPHYSSEEYYNDSYGNYQKLQ